MPRGRPKKVKTDSQDQPKDLKKKVYDFKVKLPDIVQLSTDELHKLEGYEHQIKGRFWKDGKEILCVRLIEKHM